MKKVNSLFILFFLIISNIFSQFDPPEINFIGLKENWKYISYDSNFVKYASYATPYWGRIAVQYIIKNNDLFIYENCDAQNPFTGHDGSLVHKLDLNTGKVKWIDFNNRYTGNKHFQLIQYGGMTFNSEGDLELTGFMSYDTMTKNKAGYYFYGRPFRRIVDYDTGDLLDFKFGKDTMENYASVNIGLFWKNRKGQWLRFYNDAFFKDSVLYERINFFKIDEDLNIVYPAFDSILHCTSIRTNSYFMSYQPQTIALTTDTLVFMFGTRNPAENNVLTELTLNWVDISDIDNIKVVNSINILGDVFMPMYEDLIYSYSKDGNIVLAQLLASSDTLAPAKRFTWMSWYDKNGNRMAKIDYLNSEGYIYDQGDVSVIGVKEGNLYITANRKDEEYRVHDILKIEPGINKISRVGTTKVIKTEDVKHYFDAKMFIPDDKVFARIGAVKKVPILGQTYFNYYYCFNASDLGITTKTIDIKIPRKDIEIYPNPANNTIFLVCEGEKSGYFEILDQLGRIVSQEKTEGSREISIDISGLNAGLYFVRLMDDEGRVVGKGKFVKD